MLGRYQLYFSKIHDDVETIKSENDYSNKSKAFAHWYLQNALQLDEMSIGEAIVDGFGDNGIDAIILDDTRLLLYQFKFPESEKKISSKITESTVLKLTNGYRKLLSPRKLKRANEVFLNYKELIKERTLYNYELIFVSFSEGLSLDATETLESELRDIKEKTGNTIAVQVIDKKDICDLYDKIHKSVKLDLKFKIVLNTPGYNSGDRVISYVGVINAKELLSVCSPHMDNLFDENIRLYEGEKNSVNIGILNTATSADSENFYFYHNGVVFICDKANYSIGSQELLLEGASVVNGCQTITSLKKAYDDHILKDDVFIQYRVIQTSDFDLRAKITEYLNSQIPIRDSYFLANDPFIRDLQSKLLSKGYFLERLHNEYSYKQSLGAIEEYPNDKVLKLEKVVQIYAGYYCNEHAANSKRGRSYLFDKEIIDDVLKDISPERVIESNNWYMRITKFIRAFRKTKRSGDTVFFDLIGVEVAEEEKDKTIEEYLFMNTADILLLNIVANLRNSVEYGKEDEYVLKAIELCHEEIVKEGITQYALFTRNNAVYDKLASKAVEIVS